MDLVLEKQPQVHLHLTLKLLKFFPNFIYLFIFPCRDIKLLVNSPHCRTLFLVIKKTFFDFGVISSLYLMY